MGFLKDGFWVLKWRPFGGFSHVSESTEALLPVKRTSNVSNSDRSCGRILTLGLHYCLLLHSFPIQLSKQSRQRLVLGERVSGYTEEIVHRSGSSDRHRSKLLLDILLTPVGHSNVTRVLKFTLKGGIYSPLLTGHRAKSLTESESNISYSLSGMHRHTAQLLHMQLLLKPDRSTECKQNCV